MTTRPIGIGQALNESLHLSSDETHDREKEQEAARTAYRRKYWQGYTKKIKRIFGTVSPEDYAAVKSRADEAGRSVWAQVWAEAQAYYQGRNLASGEVADQQRQLITELRRIGNNLNQLARLGHIQHRKYGGIKPSDDAITVEAMQQLAKLEEAVTKFDDGVTIRVHQDQ